MDGSRLRMILRCVIGRAVPALLYGCAVSGQCAAPPVEAFANLPAESLPAMSRDGHWFAYLERKDLQSRVVILDLVARREQRRLSVPDGSRVQSLRWNDGETLLMGVGQLNVRKNTYQRTFEFNRTIAVNVTTNSQHYIPVMDDLKHTSLPAAIVGVSRSPKPNTVVMSLEFFCKGLGCIAEVDTTTGKITPIAVGNSSTVDWVIGAGGHPVARVDWDHQAHAYHLYALGDDSIKEIFRWSDDQEPITGGLLPDGSAVVVLISNGRPHRAAWAFPLDGSAPRLLAEDPDGDIDQSYADGKTGAVIGVFVNGEDRTIRWLDAGARQRFDTAQRAFPGKHVYVYGWTDDGQKLLAQVETASTPPIIYLIDLGKHTADIAAEEYPALAGVTLGAVSELRYPARDGTPIPAYLTMPPGAHDGPVPLIVRIRSAAFSRDVPNFSWYNQFFATRGYAVLQPQFRGSTGFGEAFSDAGLKQWGGLMQDDVSDGVKAMIKQGVADPRRVCIVGEGDGGYFALAGAAFTPDLYACAVSINGMADLPAVMRDVGDPNRVNSDQISFWRAHMGDARDPNLAAHSPINAVKNVRHPVLIVYNPVPGRPSETQSEKMVHALKDVGQTVETLELPPGEGWGTTSALRVRVLTTIEAFVNRGTQAPP